ncbi:MAG TPA: hypothetical protein DEQ02_07245 [Ruminococcaceae bacterium]|nr:hypothetical protein [Oscillospiraceae bacterium]
MTVVMMIILHSRRESKGRYNARFLRITKNRITAWIPLSGKQGKVGHTMAYLANFPRPRREKLLGWGQPQTRATSGQLGQKWMALALVCRVMGYRLLRKRVELHMS